MPVLISLLGKMAPYVAIAALALVLGAYVAHRLDEGAIARVQLGLAQQQADDARAVAQANAQATADLAAMRQAEDSAMSARQAAQSVAEQSAASEQAKVTAMAAQPGQDAPTAPVLARVMRDIAQAQGGGK